MDNYNGYKCEICKQEVKEKKHFYSQHKISESNYFQKYLPKFDLITKDRIPFKSYESYILTDFITKTNLQKYLKSLNKNDALQYLSTWLKKRKDLKKNLFVPVEFESRTLCFPSIVYLIKEYEIDGYKTLCSNSTLLSRYNYSNLDFPLYIENDSLIFTIDTREQLLLKFDKFEIQKLEFGDYTVQGSDIYIERKSLPDFLGTISQGYDRFNNEIKRVIKNDCYLVILIEEQYSRLFSYKFLKHTRRVQAAPQFIHHRIRELIQLYGSHIQFLAVDGRLEAKRVIKNIFNLKKDIRSLDLQYLYDTGNL